MMKNQYIYFFIFFILASISCSVSTTGQTPTASQPAAATSTPTKMPSTETVVPIPATETFTPSPTFTLTFTPLPTETITSTPYPVVESLKAKVTAELLSCRYGPGAEYLYLYALRVGANIKLIGRADGNHWVWVDGTNKCWVNARFLDIAGDWKSLPVVYPGIAKLPITPYYPAPGWANAT